jgi:hypothetical protein
MSNKLDLHSMDRQKALETALETLEEIEDDSTHPAAMIVLPPDTGFINGNSGGFVQLAIASLKAAQGEPQSFKGQPWVGVYEYDWMLGGLTPDESAHIYLLPKKTRKSWIADKILLVVVAVFCIFLSACLSIGAFTIFHSIFKR